MRRVSIAAETWPLNRPFVISRGTRTTIDVVVVALRELEYTGRGECRPYGRYGETVDSVVEQIQSAIPMIERGGGQRELENILPPGAARNAVDCALWDLEVKQAGVRAWARTGLPSPSPVMTALTIGIDSPSVMEAAARAAGDASVLKIKLDKDAIIERVEAVHHGAPDARLIIDANEAWDADILFDVIGPLSKLGVELIEQPLPYGADDALSGWKPPVLLCADESFHIAADIDRIADRYQWVNIKLDKAGGLTAAIDAARAARSQGLHILVGCMVGTSLAMAPAFTLAGVADVMDIDGPLWLVQDRQHGMTYQGALVHPPSARLWG
jgi:L-alanine-DL-glutamate epimerase-like enolase superfamily enzyme